MTLGTPYRPDRPERPDGRESDSMPDRIYEGIKTDIVSLRLAPGAILSEPSLAVQYGVSRTPVREALRRLEQDGLIYSIPRRGTFVTQASLQDVMEIDQIREILEPAAARLAAAAVRDSELDAAEEKLREARAGGDSEAAHLAYLLADSALHDLVLQATGNRILLETVRALHNRTSAVRYATRLGRTREAVDELDAILYALRERNGSAAEQAMRTHLRRAREARARIAT
jgi:DNA-binding GntR family transcriptional regulator